jgi:hypothetical protein
MKLKLSLALLASMTACQADPARSDEAVVRIEATPAAIVVGDKGFSCSTPCALPKRLDKQAFTFKWPDGRTIVVAAPRLDTPTHGAMMFDENAILISTPNHLAIRLLVTDSSLNDNMR